LIDPARAFGLGISPVFYRVLNGLSIVHFERHSSAACCIMEVDGQLLGRNMAKLKTHTNFCNLCFPLSPTDLLRFFPPIFYTDSNPEPFD
jgi:hypothetical protein